MNLFFEPLISILIPAYNCEKHIASAIRSALEQTWEHKEIIIVDDGSTDNTLKIAKSFEIEGKLKVYTQANGGACKARNLAFSKSKGTYIQYLDADDLLSKDKLRNQMKVASSCESNIVISCSWERFYDEADIPGIAVPNRFLDRDWDQPIQWLCHSWKGKGMGQTSIWLIPREIILKAGPWDERLSINQDGEFICRTLLNSEGIRFSEHDLVYYRSGDKNSVSQTRNFTTASSLLLSYKLYEFYTLKVNNSELVRNALAYNYMSFIYSNYDTFPELVEDAKNTLVQLGVKKLPIVGGRCFKALAHAVGFEYALRLRSILK